MVTKDGQGGESMKKQNAWNFLKSAIVFNVSAQALQIVLIPILTYYFNVNEYGSWVLLQATAAIVGIVSSLRLDLALQLSNNKVELERIAFTGRTFAIFLPWIFFLPGSLIAPYSVVFGLQCAALSTLIGLNAIQTAKSLKLKRYKRVIVGQAFVSLGFSVFAIAFIKILDSTHSLFFASLLGYACSISINCEYAGWHKKTSAQNYVNLFRLIPLTIMNSKKYLRFSLPATIFNLIKEQIPIYTLFVLSGNSAIAIYSLAMRVVNVPSNLLNNVLRPKFANELSENLGKSRKLEILAIEIREIMKFLVILIACLIGIMYGFTDFFVQNVMSKGWENVGDAIRILGILMIPQVLIGWLDRTLDLMGKQDLILKYELFSIAILILLYLMSVVFELSATSYMWMYCFTLSLLYLWLMAVIFKLNNMTPHYLIRILTKLFSQIVFQIFGVIALRMAMNEIFALILLLLINLVILRKASRKLPDWFW
jgi:O-antigen/teichoic acid export membrane protein